MFANKHTDNTATSSLIAREFLKMGSDLRTSIVLGTVHNMSVSVTWLQSTFLYVRAQRNPRQYGFPQLKEDLLQHLKELCRREVSTLAEAGLVIVGENDTVTATKAGALMARYCVSFRTMTTMLKLRGDESLRELLELMSACHEFVDVKLRTSEKRPLNDFNKGIGNIRFSLEGKVKNRHDKIFCLVQAVFGCSVLSDSGLNQEANRIVRTGQRLAKCLYELVLLRGGTVHHELLLNAVLLSKCFSCRLWENSRYVGRQLERIGPALASALTAAGITSFTAMETTSPRKLEMVCNRLPPFGNRLQEFVARLPRYALTVQQTGQVSASICVVEVCVGISNSAAVQESSALPANHAVILLLGDASNATLCWARITDAALLRQGEVKRTVRVQRTEEEELFLSLVSETWAGLDVQCSFTPRYTTSAYSSHLLHKELDPVPSREPVSGSAASDNTALRPGWRPCLHNCTNKEKCAHDCCKVGVAQPATSSSGSVTVTPAVSELRGSGAVQGLPYQRIKLLEPRQQSVTTYGDASSALSVNKPSNVLPRTLSQFGFKNTKPKLHYDDSNSKNINYGNNNLETGKYLSAAGTCPRRPSNANKSCPSNANAKFGGGSLDKHSGSDVHGLKNSYLDLSWDDCIDVETIPNDNDATKEMKSTPSTRTPLMNCHEKSAVSNGLLTTMTIRKVHTTTAAATPLLRSRLTNSSSIGAVVSDCKGFPFSSGEDCHNVSADSGGSVKNNSDEQQYAFLKHLSQLNAFCINGQTGSRPGVNTVVGGKINAEANALKSYSMLSTPTTHTNINCDTGGDDRPGSSQRLTSLLEQLKNEWTHLSVPPASASTMRKSLDVSAVATKQRAVASVPAKPRVQPISQNFTVPQSGADTNSELKTAEESTSWRKVDEAIETEQLPEVTSILKRLRDVKGSSYFSSQLKKAKKCESHSSDYLDKSFSCSNNEGGNITKLIFSGDRNALVNKDETVFAIQSTKDNGDRNKSTVAFISPNMYTINKDTRNKNEPPRDAGACQASEFVQQNHVGGISAFPTPYNSPSAPYHLALPNRAPPAICYSDPLQQQQHYGVCTSPAMYSPVIHPAVYGVYSSYPYTSPVPLLHLPYTPASTVARLYQHQYGN